MSNDELIETVNKIAKKQRRYMKKLGGRKGYVVHLHNDHVLFIPPSKVRSYGNYYNRDTPRLTFSERRADYNPTSPEFHTTTYSIFCSDGYGYKWDMLLEYKLPNTPNKELLLYIESIRGCDYTEEQRIMLEMLGGCWYIKRMDVIRDYIQNLPDVSDKGGHNG